MHGLQQKITTNAKQCMYVTISSERINQIFALFGHNYGRIWNALKTNRIILSLKPHIHTCTLAVCLPSVMKIC